ncbi:MAG: response regulator [Lachnospiraceae bacterium]|nr:response regulator [Lachnospiraceae bacterium]
MKYEDILQSRFSGPAGIIAVKGNSFRVVDINEKYLSELWMNIDKRDYLDADISNSFDQDNFHLYMNAVKKCIATEEEQVVETWRALTSDCCGVGKICLKSSLVLIDNTSSEALIYEAVTNITNEKRTQDTLADIEHRYKQASEQINIYNWEYTIATKEMRPCYRCMRDLGLPALVHNYPEPAIDMGIFPPDYADMYRDMMRKVDSGVKELEADIPLTVGRVPFRVKYTTEFDEDGKPIKAFGSATLISETELGHIKVDNQIISTLAEEYNSIYLADFVNDSVKVIKHGDIFKLEENPTCGDILRVVALRLEEVKDEKACCLSDISMIRIKVFKDCDRREFVYKDEEKGKWIRIDYHVIERVVDTVDRLLITASVLDDYRAQKLDSDRLIANQKAVLEDRQNMLLEAIDEANRANRAKTVFFSNMSHDIRTPMSAITGFSKIALEELDNKKNLRDYLEKIITASDHLMNLINDILDMSRIESGKMELQTTVICLKDLLCECADMVRGEMESRDLNFVLKINDLGEDPIKCDKLRFRQIILNLLSNAYKFTPKGGSVFLEGKLIEKTEKYTYEIRVRDTGIGMSEEFSKQIWDAYSRERTDVVQETQGTGLGMAIVRNMVNLMQGTIELKTTPGKGSEFIIILPLESGKEEEVSVSDNVENSVLSKRFDGKTILVVDDTLMNIKLAEYVLCKFGFTVKTTTSGVDAIEIVRNSSPGDIDLILMDVMMPVMSGLEATRRIRALEDPNLSNIPIIAMTANAFSSDIQDTIDAGMNAHVPKPFVKEDLIAKIDANIR